MNFEIPLPLKQEHEALHDQLRQATQADGEVGELARTLARLMHPHFVKEDQIAGCRRWVCWRHWPTQRRRWSAC